MQQLAAKYRVSAMPTFKFVKGGKEIDEVSHHFARKIVQGVTTLG